jgi:hypothetical protein
VAEIIWNILGKKYYPQGLYTPLLKPDTSGEIIFSNFVNIIS